MKNANPVLVIANVAHRAISRPVHVLRLASTADSMTEKLRVLLATSSIMPICIARMYLRFCYPQAYQRNKRRPVIVDAQSEQ